MQFLSFRESNYSSLIIRYPVIRFHERLHISPLEKVNGNRLTVSPLANGEFDILYSGEEKRERKKIKKKKENLSLDGRTRRRSPLWRFIEKGKARLRWNNARKNGGKKGRGGWHRA